MNLSDFTLEGDQASRCVRLRRTVDKGKGEHVGMDFVAEFVQQGSVDKRKAYFLKPIYLYLPLTAALTSAETPVVDLKVTVAIRAAQSKKDEHPVIDELMTHTFSFGSYPISTQDKPQLDFKSGLNSPLFLEPEPSQTIAIVSIAASEEGVGGKTFGQLEKSVDSYAAAVNRASGQILELKLKD